MLTGLTGSGKTQLLKNIISNCRQPVNVICGDIQQACCNFPIVNNDPFGETQNKFEDFLKRFDSKAQLYGGVDLRTNSLNAFEYGKMVQNALLDDHLNIIEGGSAFYLYYLRTMIINEPLLATFVLYFNHLDHIKILVDRSKQMFLNGALREVWEHHISSAELGSSEFRLRPIGYDDLLECAMYIGDLGTKQDKHSILGLKTKLMQYFKEFIRKHRRYSTTQLKYLRKFFMADGDYWLNVGAESSLLTFESLMDLIAAQKKKEGGRDWGIRQNSKLYQTSIEEALNESIGEGFTDNEIADLIARFNTHLASEFLLQSNSLRRRPKKLTCI